jgi:C4-dicarboxylate transporter DctM subunit
MTATALTLLASLFGLLGLGLWIGLALLAVGAIGLWAFHSLPVHILLGQIAWNTATTAELAALPLFILMAEILSRTKLPEQMFEGVAPLADLLPGRLLHVNVLACTLFAAISGSSAATAAAIGRITLPELEKRGYDRRAAIGSLSGAGTLGFLIPPSIVLIIYGVLSETSILKLFLAGIVPGLILAGAFIAWIALRAMVAGEPQATKGPRIGLFRRLAATRKLIPLALLIGTILGLLYGGVASPNEASVVGILGALTIAALQRCLNWPMLVDAFSVTVRTTAMIALILVGASFLSVSMGFLGLPKAAAAAISSLDLPPLALVLSLMVIYVVLGCFFDSVSVIVMTLPITLPVVVAAGYHPVWYGVFLVVAAEMAQITPPVGLNLFVIQGITGESLAEVARASFPFFVIMLGFALLLAVFPGIALIMPGTAG